MEQKKEVWNITHILKANHHHLTKIINETYANKAKALKENPPKQGA